MCFVRVCKGPWAELCSPFCAQKSPAVLKVQLYDLAQIVLKVLTLRVVQEEPIIAISRLSTSASCQAHSISNRYPTSRMV